MCATSCLLWIVTFVPVVSNSIANIWYNDSFIVTASEFSAFKAQNRELSTNPCSRFLYSLGPLQLQHVVKHGLCRKISDGVINCLP